jgi:hypothetical protein
LLHAINIFLCAELMQYDNTVYYEVQ